jgi:RimJ/RimL family protein N-acetyltransferase
MTETIEIHTPRLRLRQWRESDREPFAAMGLDPRVMEHFPELADRSASDAMIERWQAHIADKGYGFWAAERRDTGEFIGVVGLQAPAKPFPFSPCVEVGWRLALAHWGQGFATEAARRCLAVGFDQLALAEIVALTTLRNLRSQAVMQRLGMQRDAATFQHPRIEAGHPQREHCLYRLSRELWAQQPFERTS